MAKFTKVLTTCFLSSLMLIIGSLSGNDMKSKSAIGVVNAQPCFSESKPALKTQQLLDALVEKTNEAIKEFDQKVSDLNAKLNDQHFRDGMTTEALDQLKKDAQKAMQDRDTARSQLQQQYSQTHVSLMQDLLAQINVASEKVAKSKNLCAIFLSDATAYFDPSVDQTMDVMKELNASSDQISMSEKNITTVPTPTISAPTSTDKSK